MQAYIKASSHIIFTLKHLKRYLGICCLASMMICIGMFSGSICQAQGLSSSGIKLIESIKTTLKMQPDIHLVIKEREMKKGVIQAAGGQFDTTVNASVGYDLEKTPTTTSEEILYRTSALESETAFYEIGVSRQFRTGIEIGSSIKMVSTDESITEASPTNRARVDFFVNIPLLKGRGKEVVSVNEMAAEKDYEISRLELYNSMSKSLLNTVSAYWGYVAAKKGLDQLKASEERAELLVKMTKVFIEADKRPAAEIDHALANLAEKRASCLNAAQALIDARYSLGLAMGLSVELTSALPLPGDKFPEIEDKDIAAVYKKSEELINHSLTRRPDFLAQKMRQDYGRILLDAAENDLLPQVDIRFNAGYSGLEEGSSFSKYIEPFGSNIPGASVAVTLNYKWPVKNSSSKGLLVQRKSAYEQYIISTNDLARQISSGIMLAIEKLKNSLSELDKSKEAVALYKRSVENEKKRFEFGVATLLDLISVEERLTSALLKEVSAQLNFANALANLNFETGNLLDSAGDEGSVSIEDIISLPLS